MLKSYSQINCQKNQMRSSRFLQYFSMRCMFQKKSRSLYFLIKKNNTKVNRDLLIFKTTNKSQMTGKTSISAYFLPSTVYCLLPTNFILHAADRQIRILGYVFPNNRIVILRQTKIFVLQDIYIMRRIIAMPLKQF